VAAAARHRPEGETMTRFAIETDDLTRSFGGQPAVDRLTLRVPEGVSWGPTAPANRRP
jgi:hypothetical protein